MALLLELIKERGLTIATDSDGSPVLRGKAGEVSPELITAMKFFRPEILSVMGIQDVKPKEEEAEKPKGPAVPRGAEIVIADEQGNVGARRKGAPYMWTWIGANTWYYVSRYPLPG